MADYRFVTIWRLAAPLGDVYAAIDDAEAWPTWWPSVRAVERLRDPEPDGLGGVLRLTFVGRLPYRLRFDLRIIRRDPPTTLAGEATGELEGLGEWSLHEEDGSTVVRYVWTVRTTRPWMNLLAPLPFMGAIFRLNHHAVMRDGLAGLRQRLGGVTGGYARED